MEQRKKLDWTKNHYLDPNPYEDLPTLNIYTYDLGSITNDLRYVDVQDKAFNFREFFRTWTGNPKDDGNYMPEGAEQGDFVHEKDVRSFLDLLCQDDEMSLYPFSNDEYRNYLRHTLWIMPGVAAARAMSQLLKNHPVFGNFNRANVAGDGDIEEPNEKAMIKVRKAITDHPEEKYSITLTVAGQRMTTGVTVEPWTGVFYLAGSYNTKASSYMQTIFRVQTPANIGGKIKEQCYVFDFAPDRTLSVLSDAAKVTTKPGQTTEGERIQLGDFLNFCPVIGISGSQMQKFDTNSMLQQLKAVYVSRVVRNGFDDKRIYNDLLLSHLRQEDLDELDEVQNIVKASKPANQPRNVDINNQGLSDEEREQLNDLSHKRELTEEEKALKKELEKKNKQKRDAYTILRAISIRIPMMVYGAKIPFDKEVTIDNFTSLVDPISWEEFMPKGISKQKFNSIRRFYDPDIFTAAGRQIRNSAKAADQYQPTERVKKIVNIFNTFKNPDKETVLTPWRVVNMHLSDTLGGYDFFDETHEEQAMLEEPRFVDRGNVTRETLANPEAHILEINSKSGLYPLYVTYSLYRKRCEQAESFFGDLTDEERLKIWKKVVAENVFVVCKTEMAMRITRRTLLGYDETAKANIRHFEDILNQINEKQKRDRLIQKLHDGLTYWKANKERNMKIDAIVGNPPYQLESENDSQNRNPPIYHKFIQLGISVNPEYMTMITPARWYSSHVLMGSFPHDFVSDRRIMYLHDYTNAGPIFPTVELKSGVSYWLWNKRHNGTCSIESNINGQLETSNRLLLSDYDDIFIRYTKGLPIIEKVQLKMEENLSSIVSPQNPFGFNTAVRGDDNRKSNSIVIYSKNLKKAYIDKSEVSLHKEWIDKYKVLTPKASEDGMLPGKVVSSLVIAPPGTCCNGTYLVIGPFDNIDEAKNAVSFISTKFCRFLIGMKKMTQDLKDQTFALSPLVKLDKCWDDEELFDLFGLVDSEREYINSMIKPIEERNLINECINYDNGIFK